MHPERRPNPGRSPESLEARLRALPQPPVPEGLEARLLAAVPARGSVPRPRWGVRALVVGAVAAACLLAVLAWYRRDGKAPAPAKQEVAHHVTPRPPEPPSGVAVWARAGRGLDAAELPPFSWPLGESRPATLAAALSPDLLD